MALSRMLGLSGVAGTGLSRMPSSMPDRGHNAGHLREPHLTLGQGHDDPTTLAMSV